VVVDVVVVVAGDITDTVQPTPAGSNVMGLARMVASNRLRTVSPMGANVSEVAPTSKVTRATVTSPVGPPEGPHVLQLWNPEIRVWQLFPVQTLVLGTVEKVWVVPALSRNVPPATDATLKMLPS